MDGAARRAARRAGSKESSKESRQQGSKVATYYVSHLAGLCTYPRGKPKKSERKLSIRHPLPQKKSLFFIDQVAQNTI